MPSTSKMMNGDAKRAAALILPLSIVYLYILKDVLPLTATLLSNYEGNQLTHHKGYANNSSTMIRSITTSAADSDDISFVSDASIITNEQLPIYLLDTTTTTTTESDDESVWVLPWGTLVWEWNRTTAYTDLTAIAESAHLPLADANKRSVVMIHCGPKSGSTTLRVACRKNLEATCGVKSKTREPTGYMDESKLYPLVRSCTDTHHFCTKETIMPVNDVPPFPNTTFIHMFPFRTYDEWARSALKQAFDRGGPRGCDKASELIRECVPSRMEIDFRKYGKTDLSRFKNNAVRRMNRYNESHVFILYHHRELENVLSKLSRAYDDVPKLPGSDGRGKSKRPEGTCDDAILQRYHDCFSHQLMELK